MSFDLYIARNLFTTTAHFFNLFIEDEVALVVLFGFVHFGRDTLAPFLFKCLGLQATVKSPM